MIQDGQLLNYVGGAWQRSLTDNFLDVNNPATAEMIVRVPLSGRDEVDAAVVGRAVRLRGLAAHPSDPAHPVSV